MFSLTKIICDCMSEPRCISAQSRTMQGDAELHSHDCTARNRFVSPGRLKLFSLRYVSRTCTLWSAEDLNYYRSALRWDACEKCSRYVLLISTDSRDRQKEKENMNEKRRVMCVVKISLQASLTSVAHMKIRRPFTNERNRLFLSNSFLMRKRRHETRYEEHLET